MAPEQLTGEPANVLTDQFSFCVALHEGLFGERPFEAQDLEQLVETVLAGRMKEPPKDSAVPARIRGAIRRGLSADPEHRFTSMDELLSALRPTRFKMKRRYIVALGLVGIALAGLVGYRGAERSRLAVCRGAERKLSGIWDGTRKAQVKSAFERTGKPYAPDAWRAVERALDVYARGWVEMRTDACEATHLRGEQSEEMLDRRVECLDAHLRQLSALTKLFSEADGDVVSRSVEASLALPGHAECANTAALKAGVKPPADPAKADRVQNVRIRLARVKALEDGGKYEEARALVEEVVSDARAAGYLPIEAEALAQAGRVAGRLDDAKKAERLLREAAEAALASGHDAIAARAFIDLVYFVGHKTARYEDAAQWSRYASLAIERLGGSDELEADRLETFSIILWKQGKSEEALAALERALALYKKRLGDDHVKVARTLDGIATAYIDLGRLEEAFNLEEQALAISEKTLGPRHPQVAMYLNNEGNELSFQGRYAEALERLRRALVITEETLGPSHPDMVPPLDSLGAVLTSMGRTAEALVYLERAKANAAHAGRKDTPDYYSVMNDIGQAELARGRADAALAAHSEALALVERLFGKEHTDYGLTLHRMAEALLALGREKEALADETEALEVVDKNPGSPAALQVLVGVGRARMRAGNAAGAVAPLERAVKLGESRAGDPRDLADARFALAQALWASPASRDRAKKLARDARATYEKASWFKDRFAAVDAWLADKDGRVTRAP
jgi:tetratricopeptide (TPR) repeat protein